MIVEDPRENYATGWVKLFRSVMDKSWYTRSDYFHLWAHIIMKATHKGKKAWFGGREIELKPGQFLTGRNALAAETGIQQSKIERIIKCFKSEQQIEQVTDFKKRLITVVSYGDYQNDEQQMNSNRTAGEQLVNTIQEDKNEKNEKNGKEESPIGESLVLDSKNLNGIGKEKTSGKKEMTSKQKCEWFVSKFNQIKKSKYRCNSKLQGQLMARLKDGYTSEEIFKAINNALKSTYHKENPTYLTPTFITRADMLDKWLNATEPKIDKPKTLTINTGPRPSGV